MKFTINWLKEHLDTSATLDQIVEKLTAIGLEVEDVQDRAATFAPFRVALIESAEKHPDADRLKVCVVNTGKEKLQVVCGAPNARAGMKGVFAPAGSIVPATGAELKKGNIRGQESNGMMVSEREMGLSDEHVGIIEVAADIELGTPMATLYGLDDPMIEINLTPNRADCAGIRGIARDLAAAGLGKLKPLDETPVKGAFESPVKVTLQDPSCPYFIGRYIRGVRNVASPDNVIKKFKGVNERIISGLVDITNYVSRDLCRPLHVFDADKLKGHIHVRLAKKGETIEALDGKTYELDDFMPVICDDSGVIAIAGVMGGLATGCDMDTKNVFLEVAYFDPYAIAKTGRALQLNSDARYRFERGVDPAFLPAACEIATKMITELCGGEVSVPVIAGAAPEWKRSIAFDPAYTKQLSGMDIDVAEQTRIMTTLGFTLNADKTVTPPSWRGDVHGRADLVEEIIRINGLDNLPAQSLRAETAITRSAETPALSSRRKARGALASRGLNESVTWSFLHRDRAALFGANDEAQAAPLRLLNPISADLDQMRPSILPNLIDAAARNRARGLPDAALFEIGPVFTSPKPNGQLMVASGVRAGAMGPRHWTGPSANRAVDAFDAKADALAVLETCGGASLTPQITREAPAHFHSGRSGALKLGNQVLAYFGEIHPQILETLDIKGPVAAFEVFLDRIPQAKKKGSARPLLKVSTLQPLSRDFAFIVDSNVAADDLVRAAKAADKNLIADVTIFDVYSGDKMEKGKKSVALAVTIQPVEQTLADADIDALMKKIVDAVMAKTGASLRK